MIRGFPKRGDKSAGVGLQYGGTTGQVQNCQVGVFLTYVTLRGHTLIDRELYLPLDWCEDRDRCRAAHIASRRYTSRPSRNWRSRCWGALRRWAAPLLGWWLIPLSGGNLDLRNWLEAHAYHYVLAVACDEPVGIVTSDGGRRLVEVRDVEALVLHEHDWQREALSEGTKGPRL